MVVDYLFQIDSAKDNGEFLESVKRRGVKNVYRGIQLVIGPGWIPDFLMVSRDDAERQCTLTLIELESKKAEALASSRKYLPESAIAILKAFHDYLDRVLVECRAREDPRTSVFEELQAFLRKEPGISIDAACALKSDPTYLERLPLNDQPQTGTQHYAHSLNREPLQTFSAPSLIFEGRLTLTQHQTVGLNRAILILDAVVREQDHGAASLKQWLAPRRNPLCRTVSESKEGYPELWRFLSSNKNRGVKLTCEALFAELSTFWSDATGKQISPDRVHRLVGEYYPVACKHSMKDGMQDVFKKVRPLIEI